MASPSELGCVYAALILADDGIEVTGEKISTLLDAASVTYEPFWPSLFAKALAGRNVKDMVSNVGSGSGGAVAAAPAAAAAAAAPAAGGAAAAPAKEEKPAPPPEDDDDGGMDGFSLFD